MKEILEQLRLEEKELQFESFNEDTAWEMLERARLNALDGDAALVAGVEDRLDAGHEAAREMLAEELGPDLLRSRMSERP